jgi:hypothetical protein
MEGILEQKIIIIKIKIRTTTKSIKFTEEK